MNIFWQNLILFYGVGGDNGGKMRAEGEEKKWRRKKQ